VTHFTSGVEVLQELLLLGLSARLQEPAPAVVVTHILPVHQPKPKINHIGLDLTTIVVFMTVHQPKPKINHIGLDLTTIVVFMTGRPGHEGSTLSSMNMTPMKYQSKITALS
jgi:hypothetical protein